jgi:hypothetical protein
MMLPMMGFAFMLIVVGGLASLVAAADARHARLAVYVGPIALFAGLGALFLSLGLPVFCEQVLRLRVLTSISFFGGYAIGTIAGTSLGLRRAVALRRRSAGLL